MTNTHLYPSNTDVHLPETGRWTIDTDHSTVAFWTRHLGVAKVRGRFSAVIAEVFVAEIPEQSTLDVVIDAASIDTGQRDRDDHLRSADFLAVAEHPNLTFRSTRVSGSGSSWQIAGELTILDNTRPVVLDATFDGVVTDPDGERRAFFSASTEINREDFGLTWNEVLETGGVLVGKRVHIELDIELVRSN